MASRHLCRTIALQTLYEYDFLGFDSEAIKKDGDLILQRNLEEFGDKLAEKKEFAQNLVQGVVNNLSALDRLIVQYTPQWPMGQITLIDRNILRIGAFEMLFSKETPPKVVINESIEVAKNFGGVNSSKFINGVLGAIYENLKKETGQN